MRLANRHSTGKDTVSNDDHRQHALYRFYDTDGQLLYVGITLDPGTRWKTHSKDKPWWLEVANVTVEVHSSRGAVIEAERAAIIAEHPKHNIQHNHTSQPALTIGELAFWPGWGSKSEDMPDDCHDHCGKVGIVCMYYPYAWADGKAFYQCTRGHRWPCWWGHNRTGAAPENAGKPQMKELIFNRATHERSSAP